MSQTQKVAVITGASQGIGAALVQGYRRIGYRVVASSRSIVASTDEQVLNLPGDVADRDAMQRLIDSAVEHFGRVDTLVNNAGIFMAKPFTAYTPQDCRQMIHTHLLGFINATQPAVEAMLRHGGGGHVLSITTSLVDHALSAVPSVLSSLTKGGINSATRSLAIELAGRGIRVNAVSPGVIKTSMHPPQAHDALAKLHPLGRMGEIAEIVDAALYLESAGFVTGEILHVDGGQSAGH